ncbi:MAG: hypothetical protein Phog2KO_47950 [Phototrophicaceae bacterium]
MANSVYMDTERVGELAERFRNFAEILNGIDTVLEIAVNTLRTTAFIGLVGGIAVERYLADIRPKIQHLAEYCEEMGADLDRAVQHFINGDEIGVSRFF